MLNYQIIHTDALEKTLERNGYELVSYTPSGAQLRSMQAWEINADVEDMRTGEIITIKVLQSYQTLVAYKMNGITYPCGKWSRTTSKQTNIWSAMH